MTPLPPLGVKNVKIQENSKKIKEGTQRDPKQLFLVP